MKIQSKIIILITCLLTITVFSIVILQYFEKKQHEIFIRTTEESRHKLINNVLEFKSKKYQQFVKDYSGWDDLVEYVKNPSKKWEDIYLAPELTVYDFDYIWIYTAVDSFIYSISAKGEKLIPQLPIPKKAIRNFNKEKNISHFFIYDNQNLVEIFGAKIVPSNDMLERKMPSQGYFFVGKSWNNKYIQELEITSDSKIKIESIKDNAAIKNDNFTIYDTRYLNNWKDEKFLKIIFSKSMSNASDHIELNKLLLIITISLSFIFLLLFFIFLRKWITVPIKNISQTLESKNIENLHHLSDKNDEFGAIAKLIEQFFQLNNRYREEMENRLKTEYELRISEENYKNIFNNSSLGIYRSTFNGKFIIVNPALAKMFGFQNPEELLKLTNNISNLYLKPETRNDIISKVISKTETQKFEVEYIKKDGAIITADLHIGKVENETNDDFYLEGFIEDITERKKIEEELIKAKEKAEQSDNLKSLFLANMSHEIRTPLNIIMGFSELIVSSETPQEYNEYAQSILQGCKDLLSIINDILDISLIESGVLKIHEVQGDINLMLNDIYNTFITQKNLLDKPSIKFKLFSIVNDSEKYILTDFKRVKQILVNLISNSIKFTNAGSVEFGCSHFKDNTLLFIVKDTGIGIPLEKQNIVFERFRQGDEASFSRKYGGTGLGLAISKSLLDLLGGKIWLESELDKGTTFYFTIPHKQVIVYNQEIKTDKIDFNWQDKVILIVEDTPDNLDFLLKILSPTKAKCIPAYDGKTAIKIFEESPEINLVLMDIRLPDISGYDLTKQFKTLRPETIIIAQTAHALDSEKQKCYKSGCDNFISKPINRKQLLLLIEQYFNQNIS